MAQTVPPEGHNPRLSPLRPVIEGVRPVVDCGRFAAKAVVGDRVRVEADVLVDGHDLVFCELRSWRDGDRRWVADPMVPMVNDRWSGEFVPTEVGLHWFEIWADVDRFGTWQRDVVSRIGAGQDIGPELEIGARLLDEAAGRARGDDRRVLSSVASYLRSGPQDLDAGVPVDVVGRGGDTFRGLLASGELADLVRRHHRHGGVRSAPARVMVEVERARYGSWYELFPRSASPDSGRPGTLRDVVERLPYLERMGIDVLYLPPVHPIGTTSRKGVDGKATPGPGAPGSPWAIGSAAGGHTSIDPGLGTLEDFDLLVAAAAGRGMAVALDLAFQCSPDHPWVHEHPGWFRHRPDGSIRYAENPPKRYEDIYPLDFECDEWEELWNALLEVVRFWIGHGITVFRVDNPHTKTFGFWEWLIATIKREHPDTVFLAEAFTRPKVMYRLAKLGFSQSYTYFTWRNGKWEIEDYLFELTRTELADYFRPNLWPNTPDILAGALQQGSRAAFISRLVLASTLAASYGVYGPAFELMEHTPREPGSEEYANSEKYEVRHWDLETPASLAGLIGRVNGIRRSNKALQFNDTLRFHPVDNDQLIAYSKTYPTGEPPTASGDQAGGEPNGVLVVVNLDPVNTQSGWLELDLGALGIPDDTAFTLHDLLDDTRYERRGRRMFVHLDPGRVPAHLFLVRPETP